MTNSPSVGCTSCEHWRVPRALRRRTWMACRRGAWRRRRNSSSATSGNRTANGRIALAACCSTLVVAAPPLRWYSAWGSRRPRRESAPHERPGHGHGLWDDRNPGPRVRGRRQGPRPPPGMSGRRVTSSSRRDGRSPRQLRAPVRESRPTCARCPGRRLGLRGCRGGQQTASCRGPRWTARRRHCRGPRPARRPTPRRRSPAGR